MVADLVLACCFAITRIFRSSIMHRCTYRFSSSIINICLLRCGVNIIVLLDRQISIWCLACLAALLVIIEVVT